MEQLKKNCIVINHQLNGTRPSSMKELQNEVAVRLTKICDLSLKNSHSTRRLEDCQGDTHLLNRTRGDLRNYTSVSFILMLRKMPLQLK